MSKSFKRVMKGEQEIMHDLLELEITNTRKNVSYNEEEEKAIWVNVPHKHFYHTVTSDGKKLDTSAPTAGHYHKVEIKYDKDGNIIGAECGPPLVKSRGKEAKYKNDNHIHEISYKHSELIKVRAKNLEATKVIGSIMEEENKAVSQGKKIATEK